MSLVTSLAHYVWGILIAAMSSFDPMLSAMMFAGFIVYEVDEDWHLNDKAFRDIREMLIGMGVAALLRLLSASVAVA